MSVAPGFRAVVFALRDLPANDQRYLTEVAHALCWPPEREPALWDTPLLLVRQSDTPPVPGLRSDDAVAASGPSVLLLAMRLVLADALLWPELRFLGLDLHHEAPDYVLYAADPARWTAQSLADTLVAGGTSTARSTAALTSACWLIQRGLQTRGPRLPPVPGDRVPVLGLQVPLFGGRLTNLRDLRTPAERQRAPLRANAPGHVAAPALPSGAIAGHHQGRYALWLHIESITPGRAADPQSEEALIDLTLLRHDTSSGTTTQAALRLTARELSVLHDAETTELTPAALSDWLAELLPSCFLVAPTGDVVLIDWFHLDFELQPATTTPAELVVRSCGQPGCAATHGEDATTEDDSDEAADPALLEVAMWSLPVFADLLATADLTFSASGRYLLLESAVPLDGELTFFSALLDVSPPSGPHILRCDLRDDETPPTLVPGETFPARRGSEAAPGAVA